MSTFEQDASANEQIGNPTLSEQSVAVATPTNMTIAMTDTVEHLLERFSNRNETAMEKFANSLTSVLKVDDSRDGGNGQNVAAPTDTTARL